MKDKKDDENLKTKLTQKLSELDIDMNIAKKIVQNIDKYEKLNTSVANRHLEKALAIISEISSIKLQTETDIDLHTEIIKGAHVVINDDGALYNKLCEHAKERVSSHYKNQKVDNKKDLSISAAGAGFNEFLCGVKRGEDGKLHTWFQFEGHSLQRDKEIESFFIKVVNTILAVLGLNTNIILHAGDFINYAFHRKKKNIGQYGSSDYTESNPLITENRTLTVEGNEVYFSDPTSEVDKAVVAIAATHSIK